MSRFTVSVFAPGLLALLLMVGCGGDDTESGPTETSSPPTPTVRSTALPTLDDGTPQSPEAFHAAFTARLDAIGPNIDSVPGDVQIQILRDCGLLSNYADRDTVAQLCNAISRSMEQHDPGLLDLVVEALRELEVD